MSGAAIGDSPFRAYDGLLPATRYHVYYVHELDRGQCIVLAVWSAVRGRGPLV